jgi:hypothetical protein
MQIPAQASDFFEMSPIHFLCGLARTQTTARNCTESIAKGKTRKKTRKKTMTKA